MIKINADRKVIENLPPQVLSNLGMNQIAYIKTELRENELSFSVFAADGNEIIAFDNMQEAKDFIRLSNLMPMTVH